MDKKNTNGHSLKEFRKTIQFDTLTTRNLQLETFDRFKVERNLARKLITLALL